MGSILRFIRRPLEWWLCVPEMATNDARRNAEYDRIGAVSAQRCADWERRHKVLQRLVMSSAESWDVWKDYYDQQGAEHSRWMRERSEERRWRTAAHDAWYAESKRLRRKSNRNLHLLFLRVGSGHGAGVGGYSGLGVNDRGHLAIDVIPFIGKVDIGE